MPKPTDYHIRHIKDPELWWNKETGWGDGASATLFTEKERLTLNLPMDGRWHREIPAANVIGAYMHCGECLKELPVGQSPAEYARFECGWTAIGLQIRCTRHDLNIVHIDFQSIQLPANAAGRNG